MVRAFVLSAGIFGLTAAASAGIIPNSAGPAANLVIKVAEECGAGFWRGPDGRCHPFAKERACPAGYHLGADGKRCWPN